MKLYVGTYAKYNDGNLDGAWLDLDDYESKDEFLDACAELHGDEKYPEFMYQDYEADNDIEKAFYSECSINADYWEYKQLLDDCGLDADTVAEFISLHGYGVLEGIQAAGDRYLGTYDSAADYAEEITRECSDIPEYLDFYIDWEKMARDMDLGGDVDFIETEAYKVAVFSAA